MALGSSIFYLLRYRFGAQGLGFKGFVTVDCLTFGSEIAVIWGRSIHLMKTSHCSSSSARCAVVKVSTSCLYTPRTSLFDALYGATTCKT